MNKVMLVSHRGERCGVQQFGRSLYRALAASGALDIHYRECGNEEELRAALKEVAPDAVVFNYHPSTLPWVVPDVVRRLDTPAFGVAHEVTQELADALGDELFDFHLCADPALMACNPIVLPVPRFIPRPVESPGAPPEIFTVGSFGFGTAGKGFDRLCRMVNEQFERATIRINIPPHDDPKIVIPAEVEKIKAACRAAITRPGITLELTERFMDEEALMAFLASNTLNAFLYDHQPGRGISSCADYALAAGRPIAISKSGMFRHLYPVNPSVCIEDLPLRRIAENGFAPLAPLQRLYSQEASGAAWARAIGQALHRRAFSRSVPDGKGFNKILDDRARKAYRGVIAELEKLAPELIRRKIPEANIQQAFALDAVERIAREKQGARILAVGAYEDTAVEALQAKGYRVTLIDPGINVDLGDFYLSAEGVPESYDIILCVSVLEHVRDDELFVKQVAELLAPEGVAVFTVDFRNDYVAGMAKPSVDFRLYSARDLAGRLMACVRDCALLDRPRWHEGVPDFEHDGAIYGFATWVFRKLPAPWRQCRDDAYREVRTTPWKEQLVAELPPRLAVKTENDRFFSGYAPRYASARTLLNLLDERDATIAGLNQELLGAQEQLARTDRLISEVQRYLAPLATPSERRDAAVAVDIEALMVHDGRVFIEHAFRVLLGREIDPTALRHHLDLLQAGMGKAALIRGMRDSGEGRNKAVSVRGLQRAILIEKMRRAPLLGPIVRLAAWLFDTRAAVRRRLGHQAAAAMERIRSEKTWPGEPDAAVSGTLRPDSGTPAGDAGVIVLAGDASASAEQAGSAFLAASSRPAVYLFVDHTIRYPGNTGIQRVARRLGRALLELGTEIRFVKWHAPTGTLVLVDRDDLSHLHQWGGPTLSREEMQTYPARNSAPVPVPRSSGAANAWLVVPEVTHITYQAAPVTLAMIMAARRLGMKTAFVFYDAVPLRRPDLKDMAAAHQAYMRQLMMADLLLPISRWSGGDLVSFLRVHERAGDASMPTICPIQLPGESHLSPRVTAGDAAGPSRKLILSVGSIVPHKNQIALVEAFERFCAESPGTDWELALAGHLHRDLAQQLNKAAKRNDRIRYLGPVSDEELDRLYRDCAFTVFPSVQEGFGLPILESLWYAKPCICANFGAMAEVAEGGGCLTTDTRSIPDLAAAIGRLVSEPGLLERLRKEAVERPMLDWSGYGKALLGRLDDFTNPAARVGTLYYCIDHTSVYPGNTGIQRVTRSLARALMETGQRLVPFVWDARDRRMRFPSQRQLDHFSRWNGPAASSWSTWREPDRRNRLDWILLPELTTYLGAERLKEFLDSVTQLGLRCASVFYDAIPWTMRGVFPEIYSAAAAELHRQYMERLNDLDLVLCISAYSRDRLVDHLDRTRLRTPALEDRIQACVLPGEFPETARVVDTKPSSGDAVRMLCVGTVEPRKNHLGLLRAYEALLKATDRPVRLVIAGGAPLPDLAREVQKLVDRLPGVTWEKSPDDQRIQALYRECDFTVYPSLEEGFGLPVLESLWNARPCICAGYSAMAELVGEGGCLALEAAGDAELCDAMLRLVTDEPFRASLAQAATRRRFRTWHDYARDVTFRLARERFVPARHAAQATLDEPAFYREFVNVARRPRLSICITTYNRAEWLAVSLRNMARLLPQPRDGLELVVCDNASTDRTPEVVKPYLSRADFRYIRNPANVGMLGNLQVTAHSAAGEYVWILGDDDLIRPGAIESVMSALAAHRDTALLYVNYAYTRQSDPSQATDLDRFLGDSTPIVAPGPDLYGSVRDICAQSENFFTAIYCLVFRRDHALRAYSQNTAGRPFSSMLTSIPTTFYVLNHMMDEPAGWIGQPQVVVNMNVSWMQYAPLWVLERLPEVYDLAERYGANPVEVDRWRVNCIPGIVHYFGKLFENDTESNSAYFSPVRLMRRIKHLQEAEACVPKLRAIYRSALRLRKPGAAIPEKRVFAAFE